MKPKTKTARRNPRWLQRGVRLPRRDCETVSNDISENLPVTKSEMLRVLKWERKNSAKLQIKINGLRDALVWVGLTIANHEPPIPEFTKCLIKISDALKQPNDQKLSHGGETNRGAQNL